MQEYYILVRSITYAQKTACILRNNGYNCKVVRRPKGLAVSGCGYAIRMQKQDISSVCTLLQSTGMPSFRVFGTPDGHAFMEIHCGP